MATTLKALPPSREKAAMHDTENQKGAGIIVVCTSTRRILMSKRGLICAYPEYWAPFGGMVEEGEDSLTAGLRELYEEAGIRIDLDDPQLVTDPWYVNQARNGFKFYSFVYASNIEPVVTLNAESSGYAWFKGSELPHPMHPGFEELLRSPQGIDLLTMLATPLGS